jgi:hypothetical protein
MPLFLHHHAALRLWSLIVGEVKRILNMLDMQSLGRLPLHQHHIKSTDSVHQMPLCQVLGRQLYQFGSLAVINCKEGASKGLGRSRFHFYKDQNPCVFGHQIHLPQSRSEIALHNAVAFFAQELLSSGLAGLAK